MQGSGGYQKSAFIMRKLDVGREGDVPLSSKHRKDCATVVMYSPYESPDGSK